MKQKAPRKNYYKLLYSASRFSTVNISDAKKLVLKNVVLPFLEFSLYTNIVHSRPLHFLQDELHHETTHVTESGRPSLL